MTVFYGPRPNDSNIVGHYMFCTVGHFVVTCDMWPDLGNILQPQCCNHLARALRCGCKL